MRKGFFHPLGILGAMLAFAFFTGGVLGAEADPPDKEKEKPKEGEVSEKPAGKPSPAGEESTAPAGETKEEKGAGKEVEVAFGEEVVTATRTKARPFRLTRFVTLVDPEMFDRQELNVAVDALEKRIGTWVEHRTGSTGDAVIRGLSGGNILALVDGCSLSTFWGEGGFAGDDMYGKVDPETVERIEVLRGPGSVLYGSQALGAVINFITRSCPLDFTEGTLAYGARSKFQFTTGNRGFTFRNEAYAAHEDIRILVGSTVRHLGDMEGGGEVGRIDPSSSKESNIDAKIDLRLKKNHLFTIAHQNVYRDPTHRAYRPTQNNTNIRQGYMFRYRGEEFEGALDNVEIKAYHQVKADRRRWLPDDPDPKVGTSTTRTYQLEAQGSLKFEAGGDHTLTGGISYHYDWGESPGDEQFTYTKGSWPVGPPGERMDAPYTFWTNYAAFVQDEYEPADRIKFTGSLRYDYFDFETDPYSHNYYPPAYVHDPSAFASLEAAQSTDDIEYSENVFTGGIGLNAGLTDWLAAVTSFTVGFRQWPPKFGLTQHGNGIYAPSTDPATIYSYNYEVGAKLNHRNLTGFATFYYNWWDGFEEWHPGSYLGQDWYDWNNNSIQEPDEQILVRESSGQAYLWGVEIQGTLHLRDALLGSGFVEGFSITGGFMYNYGKDLTSHHPDNPDIDTDDDWEYEPIRHTHPLRGIFSVKWEEPGKERFWASFTADMVGPFTRIPTGRLAGDVGYWRDVTDASQGKIRAWGLPGYSVFDLMAGWKATENLEFTMGLKNIFDRKYRRAHSRTWEMGRSFELGVDIRF